MPLYFLFGCMLLVMFMRVYLPLGVKTAGKVDKVTYLSFSERTLLQRVNVYSLGFVLLLMSLNGIVPTVVEVVVIAVALFILALPMRCILTTQGVALNNVVYRPWSEFSAYRTESRRIVLVGKEGTRPFNLPLLATHQKELIPVLRRHLSEAKDGRAVGIRRRQAAG